MLVALCQSLWDGCCETVTEGRSLFVVVHLSLSIGHFVSVGSLSVTMGWMVAMRRLLCWLDALCWASWFDRHVGWLLQVCCYGLVAVDRLFNQLL